MQIVPIELRPRIAAAYEKEFRLVMRGLRSDLKSPPRSADYCGDGPGSEAVTVHGAEAARRSAMAKGTCQAPSRGSPLRIFTQLNTEVPRFFDNLLASKVVLASKQPVIKQKKRQRQDLAIKPRRSFSFLTTNQTQIRTKLDRLGTVPSYLRLTRYHRLQGLG